MKGMLDDYLHDDEPKAEMPEADDVESEDTAYEKPEDMHMAHMEMMCKMMHMMTEMLGMFSAMMKSAPKKAAKDEDAGDA